MEQEHLTGVSREERERFERVWRRVMPEDRADSPIRLMTEPATAPRFPTGGDAQPEEPETADETGACLGKASAIHGELLQSFIVHELSDWRTYQMLARRVGGPAARRFMNIAEDERRHAKRLSTAYFLISGVQFWPEQMPPAQLTQAYPAALRERFAEEQEGRLAYQAAAAQTADPCLRELFNELAEDENSHAWAIRVMLEGLYDNNAQ